MRSTNGSLQAHVGFSTMDHYSSIDDLGREGWPTFQEEYRRFLERAEARVYERYLG